MHAFISLRGSVKPVISRQALIFCTVPATVEWYSSRESWDMPQKINRGVMKRIFFFSPLLFEFSCEEKKSGIQSVPLNARIYYVVEVGQPCDHRVGTIFPRRLRYWRVIFIKGKLRYGHKYEIENVMSRSKRDVTLVAPYRKSTSSENLAIFMLISKCILLCFF